MRALIAVLASLAFFGVLQVPGDEAYPGQKNHDEPPAGWMCQRPDIELKTDPSHWCSCERTCDPETQVVHADKQCATYCWEAKSCSCGMSNEKRCMPSEPQ